MILDTEEVEVMNIRALFLKCRNEHKAQLVGTITRSDIKEMIELGIGEYSQEAFELMKWATKEKAYKKYALISVATKTEQRYRAGHNCPAL